MSLFSSIADAEAEPSAEQRKIIKLRADLTKMPKEDEVRGAVLLGEVVTTIPTTGFSVTAVGYKNISFTVWDVGGQDKTRPRWRHHYQDTQGVILKKTLE